MTILTPEQFKKRFPSEQAPKASTQRGTVITPEEFQKRYGEKVQSEEGVSGIAGLGLGALKSVGRTVRGIGQLGEDIGNLVLPKRFEPKESIYQPDTKTGAKVEESLRAKGTAEKVGGFAGDVAQFAIPGTAIAKSAKGLSTLPRLASQAAGAGAVATAQEGKVGKETAIAGATEFVLPGVSKVVSATLLKPTKRLISSLGSGLSGVSSDVIESISKSPKTSAEVTKRIKQGGEEQIIRDQAKVILEGIQKVKRDSSKKFGEALQTLAKEDIDPLKIRMFTKDALNKNGVTVKGGNVVIDDSQILDDRIRKKATELIEQVNNKKDLSGAGVRRIMDFIESKKFTTVGGNADRGAFNKLADDVSGAFRKAVNESTDKLKQANKEYSDDRNLTDSIEKVFSRVRFGKDVDLDSIARKVETIFRKKGLDPFRIDNFLDRIGVSPEKFRASEATRQILGKGLPANTPGSSISEVLRSITGAVVTPEAVARIAQLSGMSRDVLTPILNELAPTTRALFVKSILGISDDVGDEF